MKSPYEYNIVRLVKNSNHAPFENYLASIERSEKNYHNSLLRPRETRPSILPILTFGDFDLAILFSGDENWTQRDVNLISPIQSSSMLKAGDIAVTSHSSAFFRKSENPHTKNILSSPVEFHHKPFYGFISVTIHPDLWKSYADDKVKNVPDKFINDLELSVSKLIARGTFSYLLDYSIHLSLHSADALIAVRCDNLSAPIILAEHIRSDIDLGNNKHGRKFITHTTLGLAIGIDEQANEDDFSYVRIDDELINKVETTFKFKFSCTPEFFNILRLKESSGSIGALAGYADITLILNAKQLNCILPVLYEYRLFKRSEIDWTNYQRDASCTCCLKCEECIGYIIASELAKGTDTRTQQPTSRIISLSIECLTPLNNQFDLDDVSSYEGELLIKENKRINSIRQKNIYLIEYIDVLRKHSHFLTTPKYSYVSAIGLLLDILKIYLPMGEQGDLHLNGMNIYRFAYSFARGIRESIDRIKKLQELWNPNDPNDPDKRDFKYLMAANNLSINLPELIRRGADAINVFARLVQSDNFQYLSSANFEMHTRLNAQKLLIAYSEYLEQTNETFYYEDSDNALDTAPDSKTIIQKRRIIPLLNPHLTDISVQTIRLHQSDVIKASYIEDNSSSTVDNKNVSLPILIRLPGFEQFLRIYETLPNVLHEYMHQLEDFINNKQIEIVIRFVCEKIAFSLLQVLMKRARLSISAFGGTSLQNKLINILTDFLLHRFLANTESRGFQINLLSIKESETLLCNFFFDNFSMQNTLSDSPDKSERKQAVDMFVDELKMYLEYDDVVKINDKTYTLAKFEKEAYSFSQSDKVKWDLIQTLAIKFYKFAKDKSILESDVVKDLSKNDILANAYYKRVLQEEFESKFRQLLDTLKKAMAAEPFLSCAASANTTEDANINDDKEINILRDNILAALRETVYKASPRGFDNSNVPPFKLFLYSADCLIRQLEIYGCTPLKEWWLLPRNEIYTTIKEQVNVYREIVSDLFMCAEMGLNPLGYIYVHNRIFARSDKERYTFPNIQRIFYVVCAMRNVNGDSLFKAESDCYDEAALYAFFKNQLFQMFDDQSKDLINDIERACNMLVHVAVNGDRHITTFIKGVAGEYSTKESFYEFFSFDISIDTDELIRAQLYDRFADISGIAHYLSEIRNRIDGLNADFLTDEKFLTHEKLLTHIKYLYKDFCSFRAKRKGEDCCKTNEVISRIANYYNGSIKCNDDYSPRMMLDDAVVFINEQYYQNRLFMINVDLEFPNPEVTTNV